MFNSQSYGKWREMLAQLLPDDCSSRLLNFAYLIVGIFKTQSVYLSVIARVLPIRAQKRSITKRLERLMDNDAVVVEDWYDPWASWLIESASVDGHLHLVIDTTKVSAYCRQIMISVAYQRRTLPLIWDWVEHPRGHSTAKQQIALLRRLKAMIPDDVRVSLVGDSEFGSTKVLNLLNQWHWDYVLRQAGRLLYRNRCFEDWQRLDQVAIQPGQTLCLQGVYLTQSGEVLTNVLIHWKRGEKQPWYLATNRASASAILRLYRRRMWIEEMFGDMKGHGFNLELSRLRTPQRLSRLTLAVCILYVWLVTMGEYVLLNDLKSQVDRNDRQDLSIFRLGWDWLERRFALDDPIPIQFRPTFALVSGR